MQTIATLCVIAQPAPLEEKKSVHSREEKYSGHYLFSKSISHCCMYYVQKFTTSQKSIIRTQRRKLCSRACVRKYSGQYLLSKSISYCCMYYVEKMYNKPKVNYQNKQKETVRARMCKKIFRAGRRATRVQISPPFTVFTLALSCIHPVFTLCLHCILASVVLNLYSH